MPLRFNLKTKLILLRLLPLIKNISLVPIGVNPTLIWVVIISQVFTKLT